MTSLQLIRLGSAKAFTNAIGGEQVEDDPELMFD